MEESTSSREDISGGGEGILVHNSGEGDVVVSPLSCSWEAELCARGTLTKSAAKFLPCVHKDLKGLHVESFVEQAKDFKDISKK